MKKTKIDWCDSTINPVVGCLHNCSYCYACKMNRRFKWVKDFFKPQYFSLRLKALNTKSPKSIFMDSMSDIAFWHLADEKAISQTLNAMINNPQHNYIFLTKSQEANNALPALKIGNRQFIFIGYSVDSQERLDDYNDKFDFLSIEPILEPIRLPFTSTSRLKQIIIGAETGNRKGKVIPSKEWIKSIVAQAHARKMPVFMKESLRQLMEEDFLQEPLIWANLSIVTKSRGGLNSESKA